MNLRPSGYEPDELPGCSTPRQNLADWISADPDLGVRAAFGCLWVLPLPEVPLAGFGRPAGFHEEREARTGLAVTYSPTS